MKLWPVAHFFSLIFGIREHTKHCSMSFLYSSTRNDMLQCFVCSPIPKVSVKKWATGQSVIRKEITSYRIGTLNSRFIFKNYKHTQKTDLKLFRRSIFFNPILQKNVIHLALFQPTFWERKKTIIIFFWNLGLPVL
jgi:hypothetical protein